MLPADVPLVRAILIVGGGGKSTLNLMLLPHADHYCNMQSVLALDIFSGHAIQPLPQQLLLLAGDHLQLSPESPPP